LLLSQHWARLDARAMLPVLRRLYARPPQADANLDATSDADLRALLLRRIYDAAPEEGRLLLLAEMKNPDTHFDSDALSLLPEETVPELDDVLASVLERRPDSDRHARLVARYASAAGFARLRAVYGERGGRMACAVQAPLLAYFLRVEPEQGGELLSQALGARRPGHSRCWASLLTDVAALHTGPELERVATEALDDPSTEAAADAAQTLASTGSSSAEGALWRRFERWHEEWSARAEELRAVRARRPVSAGEEATLEAQAHLEHFLYAALARGRAWVADGAKLKRLNTLCLTDDCRNETRKLADSWDTLLNIFFDASGDTAHGFMVAHYHLHTLGELKDKLARFPPATTFHVWRDERPGAARLHAELKTYLEARGMKLQIKVPPDEEATTVK
jgi:hypothetical protein